MSLLLGQLIYTSFPQVGFRTLTSPQIPLEVQRAFVEEIVHQHWDAYNPPQTGYRAAYLYQISATQTLFGWLYNDGIDDLGRSHIPYVLGYYFKGLLVTDQLKSLFNCLEQGPLTLLERNKFPSDPLKTLVISDLGNYESVHSGVSIPSGIREQSYVVLQQQQLLNIFIPVEQQNVIKQRQEPLTVKANPRLETPLSVSSPPKTPMKTDIVEEILKDLVAKPIGVQGAILVSAEGQPMTTPINFDENTALILAGTMLYLAKSTTEELNWQEIENISIRGQDGHLILANCYQETFLLVKAGKVLTGLLEGEINRTVKRLQVELAANPQLSTAHLTLAKVDDIFQELNPDLSPESESEMRYRGRPTNL